ncbi:hypothetical protein FN846DRAFT_909552 [Sphaerosporella brunnea]|uniref:Protoporphyrinogen oxidase n=1 Tax=Sphaerosporella brunnea TaxID=1250544 RepID=A0A5J5EPG1_9PEZI|nr:hypothetical protein FN846DRAFT_909552 [Sphaerosporella brunnea]
MLASSANWAPSYSAAISSFARSQCRRLTPLASRRLFSSTRCAFTDDSQQRPKSVAILGGGITGLSAAWYMTKFAPAVPVTVFEKSSRLGGWLRSKRVEYDGGSVLFEEGPRTLRSWSIPGLATIDMIRQLRLENELGYVSQTSPASQNRFIYYADRLNKLPIDVRSAIPTLFRHPLLRGSVAKSLLEPFRESRPDELKDETVGSFFSRRFSPKIAQNVISAVLHGIYAGDVDRLSAKSLFPAFWKFEDFYGSIFRGMIDNNRLAQEQDVAIQHELVPHNNEFIRERLAKSSVYFFKNGIETLSLALTKELEKSPNVTIKTSSDVSGLRYSPQNSQLPFEIRGTAQKFSHVISTLFAPVTNSLLPENLRIPALAEIEAVTVQVVNLYFRSDNILPVEGFGYLLPKSLPEAANPHKALGVIFDSCSLKQHTDTGTSVTVMFGGHYWNGRTSYPSDVEAVEMARDLLRQHLNVTDAPLATNVALNKNCIPQYYVGHDERIDQARDALKKNFGGRLSVAGNSYAGVGVNVCVNSARNTVKGMLKDGDFTGLEGLGSELRWVKRQ